MRATFCGIAATALATGAMLSASPVMAQSVSNGYNDPRIDNRVQLSLTMPLGGQRDDDYRQPRLELTSTRRNSVDFQYNFRPDMQREYRRSFAITLQDQPKMLVNGRFVEPANGRNNLTTGQIIIIGGLAVAVVSVIAITDFADALDDLSDPD